MKSHRIKISRVKPSFNEPVPEFLGLDSFSESILKCKEIDFFIVLNIDYSNLSNQDLKDAEEEALGEEDYTRACNYRDELKRRLKL